MSNDMVENVQMDVDGFLLEGQHWDEDVAFEVAAAAGIEPLTDRHWAVIQALRESFIAGEPDLFPRMPHICAAIGLDEGCVSDLFGDPLIAWQIAGLPKSGIDMSAYMPSSHLL